ncbi:MAG: hypothetical protein WBA89_18950 [Microcoleus sp.]|uniref:hypothetical protein n=1 Tax=Microcoleus sp. TaxID=44472 RepID=UPI003C75C21A
MPWQSVTLDGGKMVNLYIQEFTQECGPSCVVMISRLLGFSTDIARARHLVGKEDRNKPPGAWKDGLHDFSTDWSYMESLTQALVSVGIKGAKTFKDKTKTEYQKFCESRDEKTPAILRLQWYHGGGHFVVTIGKNTNKDKNFIEILDPFYGYKKVDIGVFPDYIINGKCIGQLDKNFSVATVKW